VRTEPLFPPPQAPARRGLLADLNPGDEHYELAVAARIAHLEALGNVETALAEVPNHFKKTVITLVVRAIGLRVAQMPQLLERQEALAALAADLRGLVEPYVKSFYVTRPWEGKKWRGRG
jgi:hypothetical protein